MNAVVVKALALHLDKVSDDEELLRELWQKVEELEAMVRDHDDRLRNRIADDD